MANRMKGLFFAVLVALLAACSQPSSRSTLPQMKAVTSLTDCDSTKLIQAIKDANTNTGADTINLYAGCTYGLTQADNGLNGLPVISDDLTINGNGSTIQRASTATTEFRIMAIAGGVNVTLNDLTIANGKVTNGKSGGGIESNGTLTLNRSTVSGNTGYVGGGISSGAGTLVLNDSTIIGNFATDGGSSGVGGGFSSNKAILNNSTVTGNTASAGGAIWAYDSVILNNSTVSGNTGTNGPGGIVAPYAGHLTLNNSTVTANKGSAGQTGGIRIDTSIDIPGGALILRSSIIAKNTGGDCVISFRTGTLNDQGYNLIGDSATACGLTNGINNNIVGQDPKLGSLLNNGGTTQTHAIGSDSPAFNKIPKGTNGCGTDLTTDQRGIKRPQGSACDIGAFELEVPDTSPPDTLIDTYPNNPSGSSVSFGFRGSDDVTASSDLTFECQIDTYPFGSCSSPKSYSNLTDGEHTFQVRAKDAAGNVDLTPDSFTWTVASDTTAPTATPSQSPAANGNGWNNSDVTVSWNWTDNAGGSGIDSVNCTTSSTSSGEGTITLTATCKDKAGNPGSASYTVKVDKTIPTIGAAATTSPNASGWYKTDVTIKFTCNDALSGIASCPTNQILSTEGSAVSSTAQTATDKAGNVSASSNVVEVKIDKTAPTISITTPSQNAQYLQNQVVTPAYSCTDSGGSTLTSCAVSSAFSTATAGSKTFMVDASDKAGNTSSKSVSYSVVSASGAITNLINQVSALNLDKNTANPMISLLQNAQSSLSKGDKAGALDKLTSFIAQVNAQRGKKISIAQADSLIAYANLIIASIKATP